jgi:Glycolipid transfer protein (GLTP)
VGSASTGQGSFQQQQPALVQGGGSGGVIDPSLSKMVTEPAPSMGMGQFIAGEPGMQPMQPVQPSSMSSGMGGMGMSFGAGGQGMMMQSAPSSSMAAPMQGQGVMMPPSAGVMAPAAGGAGMAAAGGPGAHPCVAGDASHPVARVINAFQPFTTLPLEAIPADAFCDASILIVPLYHILFGGEGQISRTLSSDVSSHIDEIRAAARSAGAPQSLLSLVQWEAMPQGSGGGGRNDMELRKGWSATHGLLWVLRAERMIARLASLLADRSQSNCSPTDLAREAYTQTLKPYHGMMVSGIVKLAFSFVPARDKLQVLFGYPSLELAYSDLSLLAQTMGGVAENLTQWLGSQGKDFPDKA